MTATLFIVTGDPRITGQTAEAVRIAAGIGVWKRNRVALYLRDAAVLALSPYADEWVDGDIFTRYLPLLFESMHPVYIQLESIWLKELGELPNACQLISDPQLASLLPDFQYCTRF